jgi:alpha-glucosidase
VDVRASDDAVAFRVVVEGSGRRVPDAATSFRLPAGSILWSHGLRDHYEAVYERRLIEDVREGEWAAPPITLKLPGNAVRAITEADLRNYAGMALQADGKGGLRERLGHDHPPGYPYTLRFGEDNAKRLAVAAPIDGRITTPWRVVIVARDLNALVNSELWPISATPGSGPLSGGNPWLKPSHGLAIP